MPQTITPGTGTMKAIAVALLIALAASVFILLQMPEFRVPSTWEGRLVTLGTILVVGMCMWIIGQRKQEPPVES